MSDIYYTSDPHFGHRLMTEEDPKGRNLRGFATVAEHDEALITNWNEKVPVDARVWILGDVVMGGLDIIETMNKLHGRKYLVMGNHDKVHPLDKRADAEFPKWLQVFENIGTVMQHKIGGMTVMLSHFPYQIEFEGDERFRQWMLPDLGKALLHGHVHSAWRRRLTSSGTMQLNVGVDVRNLRPMHVDEVVSEFRDVW